METKNNNSKENKPKTDNGKFREFFIDQLKDIYWAEQALQKALDRKSVV